MRTVSIQIVQYHSRCLNVRHKSRCPVRSLARNIFLVSFFLLCFFPACKKGPGNSIDRHKIVRRHNIVTTQNNPESPAQAGNGEFAFGVDITGLQTFVPFNTLSDWSWHSFPLPAGTSEADFKGRILKIPGREVRYCIPDSVHPEISGWLAGNPHRFNLGRIGFIIKKPDGSAATIEDLTNTRQVTDLWHGIIHSSFKFEGKTVDVTTACHPQLDAIGVSVRSDLFRSGRIKVFIDFPYADARGQAEYVGDYSSPEAHTSVIEAWDKNSFMIRRKIEGYRI